MKEQIGNGQEFPSERVLGVAEKVWSLTLKIRGFFSLPGASDEGERVLESLLEMTYEVPSNVRPLTPTEKELLSREAPTYSGKYPGSPFW